MTAYVYDCETNGFLETLTTIHSLVLKDATTTPTAGELISCLAAEHHETYRAWRAEQGLPPVRLETIEEGLRLLEEGTVIIGHNVIKFDNPALRKVYPWFKPRGTVRDTLVLARLLWADIKFADDARIKKGRLLPKFRGRYSLEAFGYRLGKWKGDYSDMMKAKGLDPWAEWNPEMQAYCEQDVEVNFALRAAAQARFQEYRFSNKSVDLEHRVQDIILRQEIYGFGFNEPKAAKLYSALVARREELFAELQVTFKPWWKNEGEKTITGTRRVKLTSLPWKPNGTRTINKGKLTERLEPTYHIALHEEGNTCTDIKLIEFNPGSRDHIAQRLTALFGWVPAEYGDDGKPTIDDSILEQLPWPEAKLIAEYMMVQKRIAAVSEGKQGWLTKVGKDGRMHGGVITNGTPTARMTHSGPNMTQVASVQVDDAGHPIMGSKGGYGYESRELFEARRGKKLVGCDADAIELRCLAGDMAKYDGGAYIETVLRGDKKAGTDMHSVNARAIGLDPKSTYNVEGAQLTGRAIAKTWFYAFIYGAGDEKLGFVMGFVADAAARGAKSRASFLKSLPALGKLTKSVKEDAKNFGYLTGLDGRKVFVRKQFSALNTRLQSSGAIIMKEALVILDDDLQAAGLVPGVNYEFCANVHDEWQIEVDEDITEKVGELAADAIRKAGVSLNFNCPLAGNYSVGNNWAETH